MPHRSMLRLLMILIARSSSSLRSVPFNDLAVFPVMRLCCVRCHILRLERLRAMEAAPNSGKLHVTVTGAVLVMVKAHDCGNCGYSLALLSYSQLTRG